MKLEGFPGASRVQSPSQGGQDAVTVSLGQGFQMRFVPSGGSKGAQTPGRRHLSRGDGESPWKGCEQGRGRVISECKERPSEAN